MLLQFGALGVTMSWDDGFLGARASRPHKAWHSLGHLLHLDQPGTEPWLSFGLADGVPAHRVAACSIVPRSKGQLTPALPGDAPGGAVGGVTSRKAGRETPVCPPAPRAIIRQFLSNRRMRWGVSAVRIIRLLGNSETNALVALRALRPLGNSRLPARCLTHRSNQLATNHWPLFT